MDYNACNTHFLDRVQNVYLKKIPLFILSANFTEKNKLNFRMLSAPLYSVIFHTPPEKSKKKILSTAA